MIKIGLLALTTIGVCIPMLMVDPLKMIRVDGTKVALPRHPSWKVELYGLWLTLTKDPLIVLLFPMFFASNWFYTWREFKIKSSRIYYPHAHIAHIRLEFNDYNNALFNIRARSLNNLVYWISQMVGSILIGLLLDSKRLSRRVRAFSGWIVLFIMVFVVHIWAYFYQRWVFFSVKLKYLVDNILQTIYQGIAAQAENGHF